MNYNFKCENEILKVWVWDDDYHEHVSIHTEVRNYERIIKEDIEGKFFTWNKHKIYLKNWVRLPMKELKEKVEKKEWITSDDLCQAILTDGIDNAKFIVPLKNYKTHNEYSNVVCKVKEEWNREVKSNYKLILVPVEESEYIQSKEDYYTMDMISLIKTGHIKIVA